MAKSRSMQIVCPHCTTSYAINPATLGETGRTVRCSRCKEVWLARPEDAVEAAALLPAIADAGRSREHADLAAQWGRGEQDEAGDHSPVVDSPSIAGGEGWQDETDTALHDERTSRAHHEAEDDQTDPPTGLLGGLKKPQRRKTRGQFFANLPIACAAMAALAAALFVWRVDVVRLAPQTASFYKMVGLDVNLRGLLFKDVKVTTEIVEGKPLLVIEGAIVGETRKSIDLPRLRFSVRDAQGAEIYAWNMVLEQTVLKPGDRAWFKSRLASPPAEGRSIDIRFFTKRDIAGASV
jgi:predicted Zn finger-like uncharacterized protein